MAGGMTLIPNNEAAVSQSRCLVDLAGCGLTGIEDEGATIRIGAMSRHVDVAESAVIQGSHTGDRWFGITNWRPAGA